MPDILGSKHTTSDPTIAYDRLESGITIVHADALDVMSRGRPRDARLLLTDPPYRLTAGGKDTGEMRGKFATGTYDNSGKLFDIVEWEDWIPMALACLDQESADILVMSNDRNLTECQTTLKGAGASFHRTLSWDKGIATPNRWYMQPMEFVSYFFVGAARTIASPKDSALLRNYRPVRNAAHPCEKPVELMEKLILNSTRPGETVFDPFMGVGPVGVAAVRTGRRFFGIEKERRWYDVAKERIMEAIGDAEAFD